MNLVCHRLRPYENDENIWRIIDHSSHQKSSCVVVQSLTNVLKNRHVFCHPALHLASKKGQSHTTTPTGAHNCCSFLTLRRSIQAQRTGTLCYVRRSLSSGWLIANIDINRRSRRRNHCAGCRTDVIHWHSGWFFSANGLAWVRHFGKEVRPWMTHAAAAGGGWLKVMTKTRRWYKQIRVDKTRTYQNSVFKFADNLWRFWNFPWSFGFTCRSHKFTARKWFSHLLSWIVD